MKLDLPGDIFKRCIKCEQIKEVSQFSLRGDGPNKPRKTCKTCDNLRPSKKDPVQSLARNAKRRAIKKRAVPKWVDKEHLIDIREIYRMSRMLSKHIGIEYHVDHIVPLNSDAVCGLHCIANLRILSAEENMSKGNHWWPNE